MTEAGARMASAMRRKGYRLTQARRAVVQVLQEHDETLSPDEVHERGRRIYASLGKVTVYRTLDLLVELGLVRRVHSDRHCRTYASAGTDWHDSGGAHRHYLVCQDCRRVTEFPCSGLDELIDEARSRTGYAITDHLLELIGLCPDCRTNERE